MVGISAAGAAAYAAWLARTGRVPGARLCSEVEWERAARGPDGRTTPDRSGCSKAMMRISTRRTNAIRWGLIRWALTPPRTAPMACPIWPGNAFEWTRGEAARLRMVVRGGSYHHDRKTAALSNRNESTGRAPRSHIRYAGLRDAPGDRYPTATWTLCGAAECRRRRS